MRFLTRGLYILLGISLVVTLTINIIYETTSMKNSYRRNGSMSRIYNRETINVNSFRQISDLKEKYEHQQKDNKLSCERFGGPSDEISSEMNYWFNIPSDSGYVSPFFQESREMYLTFEPDGGGWNNIRMAMETVVSIAIAMGRTLVMPPDQKIYLLGKSKRGSKQKIHFSFADFFDFESLNAEHKGINIIGMEEFLQNTAMKGNLINKITGKPQFPPNNRTDWNGLALHEKELYEYLRSVTHVADWRPGQCLVAFPASPSTGIKNVQEMLSNILSERDGRQLPKPDDYIGKPTPVNAQTEERLREALSDRKELCVYDEKMQKSSVVHFMCSPKNHVRLLTHFYTFLFFEDWRQDLWMKRFVRDHLRYLDELQCTAARIVNEIRERARIRDPVNNPDGLYDSFHVRRGEFQYKRTRLEASQIYENSKDKIEDGATVFIATDESKQDFFSDMGEHYDICFLSDFKHLFPNINTNFYGILDQLIASRARTFLGTYHSTFTGYINRMRGYYVQKYRLNGYMDGSIQSYYFVPLLQKESMRTYMPIKKAFFNREFPVAWLDINHGVE